MLIGSLLPILVGLPSGWFWSTFNRPLRVPLQYLKKKETYMYISLFYVPTFHILF